MSEPNPQREALVMAREAIAEACDYAWNPFEPDNQSNHYKRMIAHRAAIDAALAAPGGDETWNEAIRAAVQVSLDHVEFEQGRRTELLSRGKLSSHLDASDLHLQGASVAAKIGKDISRLLRPAPTQDGGDG